MTRHPPTTEIRILLRMILSAGVLVVLVLACAGAAAGATWVVDDDGGADFASIHAAVDAASAGDTIEVRSGTYEENVVVNKQLILRGIDTGTGMPVVDGTGSAITLNMDGIVLEGFDVRNSSYGVYITSNYNTLTNNNISNNNYYGILLYSSSNNTLTVMFQMKVGHFICEANLM